MYRGSATRQKPIQAYHSWLFRVSLMVPILNSKPVRNVTAQLPIEKTKTNCTDYSMSSFRPTSVFLLLTTSAQSSRPPPYPTSQWCTCAVLQTLLTDGKHIREGNIKQDPKALEEKELIKVSLLRASVCGTVCSNLNEAKAKTEWVDSSKLTQTRNVWLGEARKVNHG